MRSEDERQAMRNEDEMHRVVRYEVGDTTYLSRTLRDQADLIVQDGEFPFNELPEHLLRELYERGRWFSLGISRTEELPGLQRLCRMIDEGRVSYVLHQPVDGDQDVSLNDYLVGGASSEVRAQKPIFLAIEMSGNFLLSLEGESRQNGVCRLSFDRVHDLVVCGELQVDRLPLLLLEAARMEMARVTSVFAEAFRRSRKSRPRRGVLIHRILAGTGHDQVYVVSAVVPELLTGSGFRVESGGNVNDAVFELDWRTLDTDMMASLVVYSEMTGGEVPVMTGVQFRRDRTYKTLREMVSSVLYGKTEGFFAFSATPWVASPVMAALRKIASDGAGGSA